MKHHHVRFELCVYGQVQGVGFRPFVYLQAKQLQLHGTVANRGGDVFISVEGPQNAVEQFIQRIQDKAPFSANIEHLDCQQVPFDPERQFRGFSILTSIEDGDFYNIPNDLGICSRCINELEQPGNRRIGHPFIHCTQCGPRFSILRGIPYDRARTSMVEFSECHLCQLEYQQPDNRRFHAQTNACHNCGPQYFIYRLQRETQTMEACELIDTAVKALREGFILAIKSTGGYRLACLATDDRLVAHLREKKRRPQKPFALLAMSVEVIKKFANVSRLERELLESPANPIVLLKRKQLSQLAENVAPKQNRLGFMLPGSGLEYLLAKAVNLPLIMTSANLSAAPCITKNKKAHQNLVGFADIIISHDREIERRADDSVILPNKESFLTIRRSKGMSCDPIRLPEGVSAGKTILAMGGDLKNTFCLVSGGKAFLSAHMGDLNEVETQQEFRKSVFDYLKLLNIQPECIAVDAHRDYFSTRIGHELAKKWQIPVIAVQHHHAHCVSAMVENLIPSQNSVIAMVWDGIGMGDGGELWGGEFLYASVKDFKRIASFRSVPLPGGDKAAREPWRNLLAHIDQAGLLQEAKVLAKKCPTFVFFEQDKCSFLLQAIKRGLNSPSVSSAGRLFDALAAALGICDESISYEGEAAIRLQVIAEEDEHETRAYGYDFYDDGLIVRVNWARMWKGVLNDIDSEISKSTIAKKFHNTLISVGCDLAIKFSRQFECRDVVLSGGVLQNLLLLNGMTSKLESLGINVLVPQRVPFNDAGLSLGQACVARNHIHRK